MLGSVKSNIGHLEVAAGVVSLIKTILCLKNKAIPATLHFTSPNPELRLDETPFTVQSAFGPWEWDGAAEGRGEFIRGGRYQRARRLRGSTVGRFRAGRNGRSPGAPAVGRNAAALEESRTALARRDGHPGRPRPVRCRVHSRRAAQARLTWRPWCTTASTRPRCCGPPSTTMFSSANQYGDNVESSSERVVFMFPGQGAQHVGMARGLYDTEPVFAEHFDACVAGFRNEMGIDLHAEIFGDATTDLERIDRSQPALFTVEYALARLVETYGIRAGAYVGYSTGEYIAATLAGVFDLETAIKRWPCVPG